jgi:FixJ family two-component response regulator
MEESLDVGLMTDTWVRETDDRLFRNMLPEERKILQMVFRDEQNWIEIAAALNCSPQWAKDRFDEVMFYLKNRSKTRTGAAAAKDEPPAEAVAA